MEPDFTYGSSDEWKMYTIYSDDPWSIPFSYGETKVSVTNDRLKVVGGGNTTHEGISFIEHNSTNQYGTWSFDYESKSANSGYVIINFMAALSY